MKSMAVLAAAALVGLVLVMVPAGPTYAGQTPVAISNAASIGDTVVTTDAMVPVHLVHFRGYRDYRGYYGGYWPRHYGYYRYYPRYYYGYYPGYYYSSPSYCWWYGGVKYCS
jgi:hypothetical protein